MPGASIVAEVCPEGLCADLAMTFEASSRAQGFDDAFLSVDLIARGRCASGVAFPGTSSAGGSGAVHFTIPSFVLGGPDSAGCAYPESAASVTTDTAHVTLTRRGDVLARVDLPLGYTFTGPPLATAGTTPVVTEICWEIPGPSGGWCGDPPLPDDPTAFRCALQDDDGDGLSVSITFRSVDGCLTDAHCWTESGTFHPRLVAVPVRFETTGLHVYPDTRGAAVTCQAVDSRGRASRPQTICLGNC